MKFRVLVLSLAAAVPAPGETLEAQELSTSNSLTLPEAVALALESYPGIRASRHAAQGAESAAAGVSATQWPSLAFTTSATRFQEPAPVTPIHGFTPGLSPAFDRDLFQGGASLRYTVFDGWARGSRISAAREESAALAIGVTTTAQALTVRVAAVYLGILGGSSVLEAQDHRLAALDAERSRVQQFLDVGRAAHVDLLRVEAALASAQAERVSLASVVEVGEQELSRLTGISIDRARATSLASAVLEDVPLGSSESLLGEALGRNPAILAEQRRGAAADARVVAARGARWPKLDLAASYLGWASPDVSLTTEWNVGVAVSLPLFTGGALRSQVKAAEAEVSAARERVRLAESNVGQDLDRALSSVREAQARVVSLTTAVARSEEVARVEQLHMDAGSGVQRDFLDAEAQLFANRAALVQARHNQVLAHIALAHVTGVLDVAWLEETLGGTP